MNWFKKILQTLSLALLASVTFLMPSALAQDAASLEAAVVDYYDKLNNEDASETNYFLQGGDSFPRTGSLLTPSNTDINVTRANFDAGLNFDVQLLHLEAKVYGDSGVATYYTTGMTTYPDGSVLRGIFRASIVAIRQGNQWRWAHLHISPVQSAPED